VSLGFAGTLTAPTPDAHVLPPEGLTAARGSREVSLRWSSVAGATSYKIYRDTSEIARIGGTTFIDTGLTNGTNYCYTVLSVASSGTSIDSTGPAPHRHLATTALGPALPCREGLVSRAAFTIEGSFGTETTTGHCPGASEEVSWTARRD
jgi:chitodextrinase